MSSQRQEWPAIQAGHQHAEAFCRMHYRSDDGTEDEWIWNSRDGVTPFVIGSRSGKQMTHVDWQRDQFMPDYKPQSGERMFVDMTPERARAAAERNADRFWDDPAYPASAQFATKRALADMLAGSYMERPGEPDLIEVTTMSQPRCTWAINFGGNLHTRCRWQVGHDGMHQGKGLEQFDYQRISWLAGDRREYESDRTDEHAWEGATGALVNGVWVADGGRL